MPQPTKPVSPAVPQRTQAPATFSTNVDGFLTFVPTALTFMDESNTWVDGRATTATSSASAALSSETLSASSATIATSSANYIGEWTGKTGAYSVGISVSHEGALWRLNTATGSIQSIEPGVSASWTFASGTRWTNLITASQAVPANSQNNVTATGGIVQITLPTFAVNDFLVIHSTANSDSLVRILNPSHTIRGPSGSITAGNNLTIVAGGTVHLVYVAANILEIV